MKPVNQILLFYFIYLNLIYCSAQGSSTVICDVPSVKKHAIAQLDCKFPSDFQITELSFKRNINTGSGMTTVLLLYCIALHPDQQCQIREPNNVDRFWYNATTNIASIIFNASSDKVGEYFCESFPATTPKSCVFNLLTETSSTSVSTTSTDPVTTTPGQDPPTINPGVIVGIVFGILGIAAAGVLGVYFVRRRKQNTNQELSLDKTNTVDQKEPFINQPYVSDIKTQTEGKLSSGDAVSAAASDQKLNDMKVDYGTNHADENA